MTTTDAIIRLFATYPGPLSTHEIVHMLANDHAPKRVYDALRGMLERKQLALATSSASWQLLMAGKEMP